MNKKEKILRIESVDGRQAGFHVITTRQTIKLLIDNSQSCCESWGYFWCNDDVMDFIGATLLGVSLTDTALNTKMIETNGADNRDAGDIMFVNLETNKGTLQFVAYNSQNGYYGHSAYVECEQLKHEQTL